VLIAYFSSVFEAFSSKKTKLRSLKEEIKERRAKLVELLEQGEVFYEAKIVRTAYKNFGFNVKKQGSQRNASKPVQSSSLTGHPPPHPDPTTCNSQTAQEAQNISVSPT